jgi:pimeloyl-ACP methyl ester carboxylesterase
MKLFFREAGTGTPLIILHGLFGSSDNWYSLSKVFASHFRVLAVDQRNHGQSPHTPEHNYKLLTEDLDRLISDEKLANPVLIGHSMGGKTAMNFAIAHPAKLSHLIVVDIMPKSYPLHHDNILTGLKAVDLDALQSRTEADDILKRTIPNEAERQFLLKNLSRNDQKGLEWKINVPVLDASINAMGEGLQYDGRFEGPTLFVKGASSRYYKPGDEQQVEKYFPNAKWATLDTGHWVQAEKPKEFAEKVLRFLGKK